LDGITEDKIQRRNELASQEKISRREAEELGKLNNALDELGFNLSSDDPDYMDYLVRKYHSKSVEVA
jgi:hypothetical protein